jgi:hypothetical protein
MERHGTSGGRTHRVARVASVAAVITAVAVAVLAGFVGGVGALPVDGTAERSVVDDDPLAADRAVKFSVQQAAPTAACELSDREAPPGSDISVYAFDSQNAAEYRYDRTGDGTWDTDWITDGFQQFTYDDAGTYSPRVQVRNSDGLTDTAECATLTIDENRPPDPDLTFSPTSPDVGEGMTFDPSGTTDPDGDDMFVYQFDWTDDGTYEEFAETNATQTHTYNTRGEKTVRLYVEDEHDLSATTTVTFFVGRRQPDAICSVSDESVRVGEQIAIDARESSNAETAAFNVDSDDTYEYTNQNDLETSHRYETPGTYEVIVRARNGDLTDTTTCGVVTVTDNQPPEAALDYSPASPRVSDSITFDASNSTDADGSIRAYWWDFQGDGTVDLYTNVSQTSYQYRSSGSYVPTVTVVDDDGARGQTSRDVLVGGRVPPPTTLCTIEDTTVTVGEATTVDASRSDGPDTVEFDVDGDEQYERSDSGDFVVSVSYDSPGEYTVHARGRNDGGTDVVECGTVVVETTPTEVPRTSPRTFTEEFRTSTVPGEEFRSPSEVPGTDGERTPSEPGPGEESPSEGEEDPGGTVPELPDWAVPGLVGLLGLAGLGGAAYYLYPGGSGGGGGGGASAPPKPPSVPPSSKEAMFETGTFLTPPESGPVTISGLGFEPDLITFATTTNVREPDGGPTDRSDGWSHGRAIRGVEGDIPQTVVALTDDAQNFDAAMGASSDGHAIELDVHENDPPERVVGQVTDLTDDGFELRFDVTGLRDTRAGHQYVVHYQAFAFGKGGQVEVGHFRTPAFPGSQSIPLGIDADHVVLTATNTLGTVDDRRMTDLPIGFSHGEVVGRQSPGQLVRNTTVAPAGAGATAQAAFEGRALHLLYTDDDEIRGRTTATVTGLGESIDLEYEKVYSGPSKVGSVESKLVTYVAVETRDLQPTIGYFRLPEEDDLLHVDLGFEPRLIEFTTLGVEEMNTETFSRASPLGFGWSHGSAIGGREGSDGVRQYVLNDATDPARSTHEPHTGPRHEGVAASIRTLADGGRLVGRDELTVTGFTDDGFQVAVTGVNGGPDADRTRPLVFYKAWPDPDKAAERAAAGAGGRGEKRRQRGRGGQSGGQQSGRERGDQRDSGGQQGTR